MRDVSHDPFPGCVERPLTYGIVARNIGSAFWPTRGHLAVIIGIHRTGNGVRLGLMDGREVFADYGAPIYLHNRKGLR